MRHGIRILLAAPCGLLTAVVITGGPSGGAAPTPDKPEIRVELPRPRELGVKETPACLEYMDEIRGLLSQAVQQTAAM